MTRGISKIVLLQASEKQTTLLETSLPEQSTLILFCSTFWSSVQPRGLLTRQKGSSTQSKVSSQPKELFMSNSMLHPPCLRILSSIIQSEASSNHYKAYSTKLRFLSNLRLLEPNLILSNLGLLLTSPRLLPLKSGTSFFLHVKQCFSLSQIQGFLPSVRHGPSKSFNLTLILSNLRFLLLPNIRLRAA